MSVEDEKKPRKAPAKKKTSAASPADAAATAKVKTAAAPKSAVAPKKKAPAKKVSEVSAPGPNGEAKVSRRRPTNAEIAERAHGYFVARGRRHGHHEEDWLRAEQDLLGDL